jgi:hypothetical protein
MTQACRCGNAVHEGTYLCPPLRAHPRPTLADVAGY